MLEEPTKPEVESTKPDGADQGTVSKDSPPSEALITDSQVGSLGEFRSILSTMETPGSAADGKQPDGDGKQASSGKAIESPVDKALAGLQQSLDRKNPELNKVKEQVSKLIEKSGAGDKDATRALAMILLGTSGSDTVQTWATRYDGKVPDFAAFQKENPKVVAELQQQIATALANRKAPDLSGRESAALTLSSVAARSRGDEALHANIARTLGQTLDGGKADKSETRQAVVESIKQINPDSELLADAYLKNASVADLRRDFPLITRLGYVNDRTGLSVLAGQTGARVDLDLSDQASIVLKTTAIHKPDLVTDMMLRSYNRSGDQNRLLSTLGAMHQNRTELPEPVRQALHDGIINGSKPGNGFQYESAVDGMMRVSRSWNDRDLRLIASQSDPEMLSGLRVHENLISHDMQRRLIEQVRPQIDLTRPATFVERKQAVETVSAMAGSATSQDVKQLAKYGDTVAATGKSTSLLDRTTATPGEKASLQQSAAGALININQRARNREVAAEAGAALTGNSWGEGLKQPVRDEVLKYAGRSQAERVALSQPAAQQVYKNHVRPPLAEVLKRTGIQATNEEFERAALQATEKLGSSERVFQVLKQVDMVNALPPNLRKEITGSDKPVDPREVVAQVVSGTIGKSQNNFLVEGNVEQKIGALRTEESKKARTLNTEIDGLNRRKTALSKLLSEHTKEGVGIIDRALFWQGNVETFEKKQAEMLRQIKDIERKIEEKTRDSQLATGRTQLLDMATETGRHSQLKLEGKQLDADKMAMRMWGQYGDLISPSVARDLVQPDANGKNAFQRLKEQGLAVSDRMPAMTSGTAEGFKNALDALKALPVSGDRKVDVDAIRQNAIRTLSTAPEFKELLEGSQVLATNLPVMQEMFLSGMQGTKYEDFVKNARERATAIETAMKEVEPHLQGMKARIEEMKKTAGELKDETAKKELLDQAKRLEESIKIFDPHSDENKQFKHMINTIKSEKFDENTMANWWKKNGVVVAVTIGAAVLAVATLGAAVPALVAAAGYTTLTGLGASLTIAAAGAAGGIIGGELAKEGLHGINQVYDTGLGTGDRSRLGEYWSGNPEIDMFTGKERNRELWADVIQPYTVDFVKGTALTFATMGAGHFLAKGINSGLSRLGDSKMAQFVTRNAKQLDEVAAKSRNVDELMARHGGQHTFSNRFMREFGDECFDEVKETTAEDLIQKSLGQSNSVLGFMASSLVAGSKGVRFDSFNRSNNTIGFQADSQASVEALRKNLEGKGYRIEDGSNGAMLVTGKDGVTLTLVNGDAVAVSTPRREETGNGKETADAQMREAVAPELTAVAEPTTAAKQTIIAEQSATASEKTAAPERTTPVSESKTVAERTTTWQERTSSPNDRSGGEERQNAQPKPSRIAALAGVSKLFQGPMLAEVGRRDAIETKGDSSNPAKVELPISDLATNRPETQIDAELLSNPSYIAFQTKLSESLKSAFPTNTDAHKADFDTLTRELYLSLKATGKQTDAGKILDSVGKILESESLAIPLSQVERVGLAKQILHESANAKDIDQGTDFTCGPSVTQEMLLHRAPAQYADAIASLVTTGKFKSSGPRPVEVDLSQEMLSKLPSQYHQVLSPDSQASRSLEVAAEAGFAPKIQGERTYASQLGQLLAANIHTQNLPPGARSVYVKGPVDPRAAGILDTGERQFLVSDGDSFELLLAENGTAKLGPGMKSTDLQAVFEAISGRSLQSDFVLINSSAPIAKGHGKAFSTEAEFDRALTAGSGPFVVEVDPAHWLFQNDSSSATTSTAVTPSGNRPQRHVVLVDVVRDGTGEPVVDPKTGTVMLNVYDQYGPGKNFSGDNAIAAGALFDATRYDDNTKNYEKSDAQSIGARSLTATIADHQGVRDALRLVTELERNSSLTNKSLTQLKSIRTWLQNTSSIPTSIQNRLEDLGMYAERRDIPSVTSTIARMDSMVARIEGPRVVNELSKRFQTGNKPEALSELADYAADGFLGPANVRLLQRLADNGFSNSEVRIAIEYIRDRADLQNIKTLLDDKASPYHQGLSPSARMLIASSIDAELMYVPGRRNDRQWVSDISHQAKTTGSLREALSLLGQRDVLKNHPDEFTAVATAIVNKGRGQAQAVERLRKTLSPSLAEPVVSAKVESGQAGTADSATGKSAADNESGVVQSAKSGENGKISESGEARETGKIEEPAAKPVESKYATVRYKFGLSDQDLERLNAPGLNDGTRRLLDRVLLGQPVPGRDPLDKLGANGMDPLVPNAAMVQTLVGLSDKDLDDLLLAEDYKGLLLRGMQSGWNVKTVQSFLAKHPDIQLHLAAEFLDTTNGAIDGVAAAEIISLESDEIFEISYSPHSEVILEALRQGRMSAQTALELVTLPENAQRDIIGWTNPTTPQELPLIDNKDVGRVVTRPALQSAIASGSLSPRQVRNLLALDDNTLDMVLNTKQVATADLGIYSRYSPATIKAVLDTQGDTRTRLELLLAQADAVPKDMALILREYNNGAISDKDSEQLTTAIDRTNFAVIAELHKLPVEFRKIGLDVLTSPDPSVEAAQSDSDTSLNILINAKNAQDVQNAYQHYIKPRTAEVQPSEVSPFPGDFMRLGQSERQKISGLWRSYSDLFGANSDGPRFLHDWSKNKNHVPTVKDLEQVEKRGREALLTGDRNLFSRARNYVESGYSPAEAIELAVIRGLPGVSDSSAESIYIDLLDNESYLSTPIANQQRDRLEKFRTESASKELDSLDATQLAVAFRLDNPRRLEQIANHLSKPGVELAPPELIHLLDNAPRIKNHDNREEIIDALLPRILTSAQKADRSERLQLAQALARTDIGDSFVSFDQRRALIDFLNQETGENVDSVPGYARTVKALMGADIGFDVLTQRQMASLMTNVRSSDKELEARLLEAIESKSTAEELLPYLKASSLDTPARLRASLIMQATKISDLSRLPAGIRAEVASKVLGIFDPDLRGWMVNQSDRQMIETARAEGKISAALADKLLKGQFTRRSLDEGDGILDDEIGKNLKARIKANSIAAVRSTHDLLESPLNLSTSGMATLSRDFAKMVNAFKSEVGNGVRQEALIRIEELRQGKDTSFARTPLEQKGLLLAQDIDRISDLPAADQQSEVHKLLGEIEPGSLQYLPEAKLEWLTDRYRERLSQKLLELSADDAAGVYANIDKIVNGRVGQAIPRAVAESLVVELRKLGLSEVELERAVAKLEQRRGYLSIAGLSEHFDNLAMELSPQGSHFHYVKPRVFGRAKKGAEIDVLVFQDGSPGTQLAYNFFKAEEYHLNVNKIRLNPNNPNQTLLTNSNGKTFELSGESMYEVELDGESNQWRRTDSKPVAIPRMVLLDNPGLPDLPFDKADTMRARLTGLQNNDRLYVPETLAGSLDARMSAQVEPGFDGDINLFDLADTMSGPSIDVAGSSTVNPAGVARLARMLSARVSSEISPQDASVEKRVIEQDLVDRIIRSPRTTERAATEVRLLQHLLANNMTAEQAAAQMELWGDHVDYRSMGDFMRFSRELESRLRQTLEKDGKTLGDAYFIIPPNSGSEFFIHELYRKSTGTSSDKFLSVAEATRMASDGELAGKSIVLLDDGFDFGVESIKKIEAARAIAEAQKQHAQQSVAAAVDAKRIPGGQQAEAAYSSLRVNGIVIASLFVFDKDVDRQTKLAEWRSKLHKDPVNPIPPELSVEMVHVVDSRPLTDYIEEEVPGISRDGLETPQWSKNKENVQRPDSAKNSTENGTNTEYGVAELWPYLQPNNVSWALFDFATKVLGHFPTRASDSYPLFKPLRQSLPEYYENSTTEKTARQRADILIASLGDNIDSQKTDRTWGEAEMQAAKAYRRALEIAKTDEDSHRLNSLLSVADNAFGNDAVHVTALARMYRDTRTKSILDFSSIERFHSRHRLDYQFKIPTDTASGQKKSYGVPVFIAGRHIVLDSLVCQRVSDSHDAPFGVFLTYKNEVGETTRERLGHEEATLLNELHDTLAEAGIRGSEIDNPHANAQMLAAYLARIAESGRVNPISQETLKELAQTLSKDVADNKTLNISMKQAHRQFDLDYELKDSSVTLDLDGDQVYVTGLKMNWDEDKRSTGKISFTGLRSDGSAIDSQTSNRIENMLVEHLTSKESTMKTLFNETNKAGKAHLLAVFLDRMALKNGTTSDTRGGDRGREIGGRWQRNDGNHESESAPIDWSKATRIDSGEHVVTKGVFVVGGSARVTASGDAVVRASGDAVVEASASVMVEADGNAQIYASGESRVLASGNAYVSASKNARVTASGNSRIKAAGHSTVKASGNAQVDASGETDIEARGNARLRAEGKAGVTAFDEVSVTAGGEAEISARDQSSVTASGNSRVYTRDKSRAEVTDNVQVMATHQSSVTASGAANLSLGGEVKASVRDQVNVTASKNSRVQASGDANVRAQDTAFVDARDNAIVVARNSSTVNATDNAAVSAWDIAIVTASRQARVVGNDASSVELYDDAHAEVTTLARVIKHGNSTSIVGGAAKVTILQISPHNRTIEPTYSEDSPVIKIKRDNEGAIVQVFARPQTRGNSGVRSEGKDGELNTGTGFFTSHGGELATAYHVVSDSNGDIRIRLRDGSTYKATIVAVDHASDSALLQAEPDMPSPEKIVEFANDSGDQKDVDVLVLGHADGKSQITASPGKTTGTKTLREYKDSGERKSVGEDLDLALLDLTSRTLGGNSGSPLFRVNDGKVIGLVTKGGAGSYQTLAVKLHDLKRLVASRDPNRQYNIDRNANDLNGSSGSIAGNRDAGIAQANDTGFGSRHTDETPRPVSFNTAQPKSFDIPRTGIVELGRMMREESPADQIRLVQEVVKSRPDVPAGSWMRLIGKAEMKAFLRAIDQMYPETALRNCAYLIDTRNLRPPTPDSPPIDFKAWEEALTTVKNEKLSAPKPD